MGIARQSVERFLLSSWTPIRIDSDHFYRSPISAEAPASELELVIIDGLIDVMPCLFIRLNCRSGLDLSLFTGIRVKFSRAELSPLHQQEKHRNKNQDMNC